MLMLGYILLRRRICIKFTLVLGKPFAFYVACMSAPLMEQEYVYRMSQKVSLPYLSVAVDLCPLQSSAPYLSPNPTFAGRTLLHAPSETFLRLNATRQW